MQAIETTRAGKLTAGDAGRAEKPKSHILNSPEFYRDLDTNIIKISLNYLLAHSSFHNGLNGTVNSKNYNEITQ